MTDAEYEAWRPALNAFYKADCWFQSAQNLEVFNHPLEIQDRRIIDSLRAAFVAAPEPMRKAA